MILRIIFSILFISSVVNNSYSASINDDEETPKIIVSAAERSYVDVIDSMIANGVDINIKDANGCSALSTASENGRTELVKFLLSKGADKSHMKSLHHSPMNIPEIKDDYEAPKIFIYCVRYGIKNAVISMLNRGVDINSSDSQMDNALAVAAINGHINIADLLLKKGADVNQINGFGQTPAVSAIRNGGADGAELIIRNGGKFQGIDLDWYTSKMFAVISGKDTALESCDPQSEKTVLMMAAEKNHTGTVRYLVKRGAKINAEFSSTRREHRPFNGSTALIFALRDRSGTDAAVELIRLKASLDNLNNSDETALLSAVYHAMPDMVKVLLDAGANVNRADSFGKTPYYHAMMNGNEEIMAILKARGGR
jgi:ankyrin repeat protein